MDKTKVMNIKKYSTHMCEYLKKAVQYNLRSKYTPKLSLYLNHFNQNPISDPHGNV